MLRYPSRTAVIVTTAAAAALLAPSAPALAAASAGDGPLLVAPSWPSGPLVTGPTGVAVTVSPTGRVGRLPATAVLVGSVRCDAGPGVRLTGRVTQLLVTRLVTGTVDATRTCTGGWARWTAVVPADRYTFSAGKAAVRLRATACDGEGCHVRDVLATVVLAPADGHAVRRSALP